MYLLIEGGKALDLFNQYDANKRRVHVENMAIANELGVTQCSRDRFTGAINGVIFNGEIHPEFNARHKKTKLSYPKKGSSWEKRFNANTMDTAVKVITEAFDIPLSIGYKGASIEGWANIGHAFNECGFLSLGEHHCMYVPDVLAAIAEIESHGDTVKEPAKSFKPNYEGCRQITEEEWELMGAQQNAGLPVTVPSAHQGSFQARVKPWMEACFTPDVINDPVERNHRFIEEALELAQACGASAEEMHNLVEYVFNRPVGEKSQEVGGVAVTLAALCNAQGIDIEASQETELARIWTCIQKIRDKQAIKPDFRKGPSL